LHYPRAFLGVVNYYEACFVPQMTFLVILANNIADIASNHPVIRCQTVMIMYTATVPVTGYVTVKPLN